MTSVSHPHAALRAPGHARALLSLGLPLVGSHLAQFAVTMTDTLMLGWYDPAALAALTVAGSAWFVLFLFGSGFAAAAMPMIAAALGTGDHVQVRRVTRMALWLSAMFGVAVIPAMIFSGPILRALGQPDEVVRQGALYLSVAGFGLIPGLLVMAMKSYFSALERTRAILIVTVGGAALNAVLNYALIFGNWGAPELGILGAAIASVTLHVAMFLALILHAARATPEYELFRNIHRPDWEVFGAVFRLGWPVGLTWLAEVGLFAGAAIMVGWIGTLELAAHGIALQIASATFMVHLGLSQAVTVRTGRFWGQGDRAALRTGALVALILSAGFVALTVLVFLTVPEPLIGAFLSPDEPDRAAIVALGVTLLAAAALFQAVDAAQVMALGMLRGVQDTRVPMVIAAVSYWGVGIGSSYVLGFPLDLGVVGIWLGLAIGLAFAGVLLSWRFWGRVGRPVPAG